MSTSSHLWQLRNKNAVYFCVQIGVFGNTLRNKCLVFILKCWFGFNKIVVNLKKLNEDFCGHTKKLRVSEFKINKIRNV